MFSKEGGVFAGKIEKKVSTAWSKIEAKPSSIRCDTNKAIDKQNSKVNIENLIVKCEKLSTRVIDKNEQIIDDAHKTEDPYIALGTLKSG